MEGNANTKKTTDLQSSSNLYTTQDSPWNQQQPTEDRSTGGLSKFRSDRRARIFVWSVWLLMVVLDLICILKYGRNIPLAEDWQLVAPLTGNEPNFARWLWSQNNEHRVPLPRLILLGLLWITNGDFRAGMVMNVITLSFLAFAAIRVTYFLRRGKTHSVDAFFPIALLHLGNWPNLFWSWQLSFVVPVALICGVLLAIISQRTIPTPGAIIFSGLCLVLLPLCGAIGVVFVPPLSLWFIYSGVLEWRSRRTRGNRGWIPIFLLSSALIALCIMGLYFIGYQRAYWNPPSPSLEATLKTTAKFLALGFGPIARKSWMLSVMAAFGVLAPCASVAILAVFRNNGTERHRALGVLILFGNISLLSLAIGHGRAGLVPKIGVPIRYVLLGSMAFFMAFFVWELYGSSKRKSIVQRFLLLAMCLLLPLNTIEGVQKWGIWYHRGMTSLEEDLRAGIPSNLLAERHRDFLIHWWSTDQLAIRMKMLHDAGFGPFTQIPE